MDRQHTGVASLLFMTSLYETAQAARREKQMTGKSVRDIVPIHASHDACPFPVAALP
jgi:hypothetical protein